ncbi:MAG: D-alanine--D-alanine ligase [Candidatus Aminicenantes bacterium]|nr:D-alanine--D-alanine ligase [Candidatus Aminicenantes bacterium]
MKPKKLRVALLFGGRSAEHEISLVSASAIYRHLDKKKYEIVSFYLPRQGGWKEVASPLSPPNELEEGPSFPFLPWEMTQKFSYPEIDIYFPVLHGPYGEDGTIQGMLELAGVPYVGAGVLASALGMDKVAMKAAFASRNLPLVPYLSFIEREWEKRAKEIIDQIRSTFPLPLFVKPANLGSSVGITKVKTWDELEEAVKIAFNYDRKVLIEEGIPAREIECSVLGNDEPRASLPGEVIPFREFYDYKDKYIEGKTGFKIPADLTPDQIAKVQHLSIEAYRAIDCSGMARVDLFLDRRNGAIYINEVNTIPGFTEISMYPKLWEASGLPFSQLLDELIILGFERFEKKKKCLRPSL